ncbi:hypothetical protein BDZ45DRAFT_183191 [Acephala macrosclerotiorum]|nr:hypothetical protein BDZ45DRAFT_183191 [Acephala macrosclerotiorum]
MFRLVAIVTNLGDTTAEERGGSLDDNESALGGNSSGSLEDPIVLLGNDDSSASEAEVDNGDLHAESAAADEGLLDNPETAIESTTPAFPSNPDVWHDIDDFPETAQRSRRSKRKPSTSDSMRSHTSFSSRASGELLHDHTSVVGNVRSAPDPRPRCALLLVAISPHFAPER